MSPHHVAIQEIIEQLSAHHPRRIPGRNRLTQAAVAAILNDHDGELKILLVKRASRPGDPWSGDMAFPGGRRQLEDPNTLATAIRETQEETGLLLNETDCIARLSDVVTRKHEHWRPMIVSPYLFQLSAQQASEKTLELNQELQSRIWVPLHVLFDEQQRKTMRWRLGPMNVKAPCLHYEGHRIWGLTLLMIDGLQKALS